MNMRKIVLTVLMILSIITATLSALSLILISGHLIKTGATYSISTESGGMACGIPYFTKENWIEASLEIFGTPILIFAVSFLISRFCFRSLSKMKLP